MGLGGSHRQLQGAPEDETEDSPTGDDQAVHLVEASRRGLAGADPRTGSRTTRLRFDGSSGSPGQCGAVPTGTPPRPPAAADLPAGRWVVESTSEVGFVARELLVRRVQGRFRQFEGALEVRPGITGTTVAGQALASSVDTGDPARDQHLRQELLEAGRFPWLTLAGEVVAPGSVEGSWRLAAVLGIRDARRPLDLEVHVHGTQDEQARPRLAMTALGTIKRSAFGLRFSSALETGGVIVADEVELVLRVAARPAYFFDDVK